MIEMGYLKEKKILFVSPKFFGYEIEIINELKRQGGDVTYFADEPPKTIFKYLLKYLIGIDNNNQYVSKIKANITKNKYDILFVIKGTCLNSEILELYTEFNSSSKKIMYQYDSLFLVPSTAKDILKYFDSIYSFDIEDCKLNPELNLIFRPLFYSSNFEDLNGFENFSIDVLSVCSYYPRRLEYFNLLKEKIKDLKFHFYVWINIFSFLRILNKIGFTNLKQLRFIKLSKQRLVNLMICSKSILDIEFLNQKGLTIRTLEVLGMNKKLITTNGNVRNYDFYDPKNIYILTPDNIYGISEFLNTPSVDVLPAVKYKYSLECWCFDVLNGLHLNFLKEVY